MSNSSFGFQIRYACYPCVHNMLTTWESDCKEAPVAGRPARPGAKHARCWRGTATSKPSSSRWSMPPIEKSLYGGFLSYRGTPSHHPFLDGIFHCKPSILGYTPIYGNHHIHFWQSGDRFLSRIHRFFLLLENLMLSAFTDCDIPQEELVSFNPTRIINHSLSVLSTCPLWSSPHSLIMFDEMLIPKMGISLCCLLLYLLIHVWSRKSPRASGGGRGARAHKSPGNHRQHGVSPVTHSTPPQKPSFRWRDLQMFGTINGGVFHRGWDCQLAKQLWNSIRTLSATRLFFHIYVLVYRRVYLESGAF